jgi:hypothetical protein
VTGSSVTATCSSFYQGASTILHLIVPEVCSTARPYVCDGSALCTLKADQRKPCLQMIYTHGAPNMQCVADPDHLLIMGWLSPAVISKYHDSTTLWREVSCRPSMVCNVQQILHTILHTNESHMLSGIQQCSKHNRTGKAVRHIPQWVVQCRCSNIILLLKRQCCCNNRQLPPTNADK